MSVVPPPPTPAGPTPEAADVMLKARLFPRFPPLLAAPPSSLSFIGRFHSKISPHLTTSNIQRAVITLVVVVVSYAILTTPEARRKVLRLLGPPRWVVRKVRRQVRKLYAKFSGGRYVGDEYTAEHGFFIEPGPAPKKKKKKKSSRWNIYQKSGNGGNGHGGGNAGRLAGLIQYWRSFIPGGGGLATAAGTGSEKGETDGGGQGQQGGRVHLTSTSADHRARNHDAAAAATAGHDDQALQMSTPDRAAQRSRRRLLSAGMPSPIVERDESSPSATSAHCDDHHVLPSVQNHSQHHHQQQHQHPVLRHAYSAISPARTATAATAAATTTTSASSLCTGLILPDESTQDKDMEETDHDRFARAWSRIRISAYGRLVLPPECRFVEPGGRQTKGGEGEDGTEAEEMAAMSWRIWFLHIVAGLFHKSKERCRAVVTYDYVATAVGFYLNLMNFVRYRRDRMLGRPRPDDEEDDDDEDDEDDDEQSVSSVISSSSFRRLGAKTHSGLAAAIGVGGDQHQTSPSKNRDRFFSVDPKHHESEEKKDAADGGMEINTSGSKDCPKPSPVLSTDDVNEPWATPGKGVGLASSHATELQPVPQDDGGNTTPSRPVGKSKFVLAAPGGGGEDSSSAGTTSAGGVNMFKKRDALEAYRSRSASSQVDVGTSQTPEKKLQLSPLPLLHSRSTPTLSNTGDRSSATSEDSPRRSDSEQPSASSHQDLKFFDAAVSKASLKRLARDVPLPVPDRNGYILGDDLLPDSRWTPLLVFVNSRSGPQQGQLILMQLRRLLNPIQIYDLADGDPTNVLQSFLVLSKLRILVCGGDGTVSWIISTLEKMNLERRWPPIAILPLGTGNDLARVHGWGAGYNNESILMILEQITEAYVSLLDRWELTIEKKKGKVKDTKSFMNYLGVGVDAQTALGFHNLRENRPKLFFSRAVNKAWYIVSGAEDAIKASCAGLPEEITLVADGVEMPLPPDSQGIILLNIDSYAGGVPLWSHGERPRRMRGRRHSEGDILARRRASSLGEENDSADDFDTEEFVRELDYEEKLAKVTACDMPSSCQDGMLDIVSIKSIFHMGQIKVGLSSAQLICQCSDVTIKLKKKVPVQIDGEPWKQSSCTIRIRRKKDPALMLHRAAAEGGGVETEMAKLLDWAEDRQIIDKNVHATLMREFSRRIESKTRQKRVLSNDNLFFSMKRAMGAGKTSAGPPF